ncbi:uncharacterized protein LOC125827768 [Solanum verrucosum]|uniref:uncharacterized protein LOC125827768 n=1 Tax=Solanum verrucosum TaxID=315347 RepID=UPI0020D145CB|nr:uncharacterized protein LOC125827768 [Solanum verrucosum]
MAVVLRYVDRRGFVMKRLLDIVHVKNTSALSLKEAIVNLFSQHSLSISYVRGQCYDGASNMQGDINGLKMLIKKESRSAYSIHCSAHQLQLTLVGVSKRCLQVGELVHLVSNIFNVLAASYKRMDDYRESQKKKIKKLLIWFGTIMDILDNIVEIAHSMDERSRATGYIRIAQTYEVAFMLHLMKEVLGITNDLSTCLQKKGQDIANAMLLVKVAKRSMCALENQLANYIIDVCDIDKRFSDLHGLCDLSKRLVQTKKYSCYPLVFRLVKFLLLLPVATASVERAFSGMKFIKNEFRSRMNDDFLSGCMVPFMEKDVFKDVSTDDIILSFQAMKPRRIVKDQEKGNTGKKRAKKWKKLKGSKVGTRQSHSVSHRVDLQFSKSSNKPAHGQDQLGDWMGISVIWGSVQRCQFSLPKATA